MFSMQYRVPFGRDFDMEQIRSRIVARTAPYDDLPGLAYKAFMMQTLAGEGMNSYSSYYVWRHPAAFDAFLTNDEMFGAIVHSFGRPTVALEIVLDLQQLKPDAHPIYAVHSSLTVPDGHTHRQAIETLKDSHAVFTPTDSVTTVTGDPWRVSRFSLLEEEPDTQARERLGVDSHWFKVVHISQPAKA